MDITWENHKRSLYPPRLSQKLKVLSFGAGVQSSTLLMLYENGVLPNPPDFAIFADTQAEPQAVYKWLKFIRKKTKIPIYIFTRGDLAEDYIVTSGITGKDFNILPVHSLNSKGNPGIGKRQCTRDYKIDVIYQGIRMILRYEKGEPQGDTSVEMVIGISLDEIQRMKTSMLAWVKNSYPLVDMGWTRDNCKEYFAKLNFPTPPRSSCYFCPFRSNNQWLDLKRNHKYDWRKALKIDKALRARGEFLHRSLVPLIDADLKEKDNPQIDGIVNECSGICGV